MAKIIYDKSPLDKAQREIKEYENDVSLGRVLDDLKCFSDCCVEINGVIPDELTEGKILKKGDIVRIRKPLHGGGNNRKILGRIIQVVGLIVAALPGVNALAGTIIIAGTSLIGGLIAASANKPPAVQDRNEGEAAAQAFNITSSQNEVRKLEPVALTMGSHRVSPDFGSQPYQFYSGGGTPVVDNRWANGVINISNSFPTTLPAGWISANIFNQFDWSGHNPVNDNWWPYPIQVQAGFNSANFIADAKLQTSVTVSGPSTLYSYDYMSFTTFTAQNYLTPNGTINGRAPIIIRHTHPNDPIVVANNNQPFTSTLQLLCWAYFSQWKFDAGTYGNSSQLPDFNDEAHGAGVIFNNAFDDAYKYLVGLSTLNSDPLAADAYINSINGGTTAQTFSNLYRKKDITDGNGPSGGDIWFNVQMTENTVHNFGGADYTPEPQVLLGYEYEDSGGTTQTISIQQRKQAMDSFVANLNTTTTPSVVGRFFRSFSVPEVPKAQEVRHIFHYGLGDIEISDRRIGDTDLTKITGQQNLLASKGQTAWPLDQAQYHSNVKIVDGADLINNAEFSGSESLESLSPNVVSNFITRETPEKTTLIHINIEGRSFETDNDDPNEPFKLFGADFEIQYRLVGSPIFTLWDGSYFLASNKPDPIRETIEIPLPSGKYEIRIRKRTKDPIDSRFSQEFNITSFNFFVEDSSPYVAENREGLRLIATGSFNGTTQKYNTLVEAKCWVYNGSNWNWEHTRNPAWWFLYYARGGFKNASADGSFTYPYSPTKGWVNSADHPDNLERYFGAGRSDDLIDIDKIIEWAEFCDVNDLKCDLVVRADSSAHDVMQRIAGTGRASVHYYTSRLSIVFEDPEEPVSGMFGMSNMLKGSFQIIYAVEDLPYKVVGKFSDRDDEWKTGEVEAIVPNSLPDNLNIESVVLDGITDRDRAQREVNILAARQAFQRRSYQWSTSEEGRTVQRGDKVYLSHDVTCYDQSGRVYGAKIEDGFVTELETNITLKTTTSIMLRFLDGEIESFDASNDGTKLIIQPGLIPAHKIPQIINQCDGYNSASDYPGSVIEDLIFFAGPKATPGKAVRVVSVEPQDGLSKFKITAIEEDPIIWAFEYDNTLTLEENYHERIEAVVSNATWKSLGDNLYKIEWEMEGAHAAVINLKTGPLTSSIQSEGQYTMFNDSAIIDLDEGGVYNLEIMPVCFGLDCVRTPYRLTIRT